ncbi:MAG TPA: hypothetical protein DIT63_05555, partial [Gammaproteobacteria bacterium]|nr:hypothetical protein [Gammaproteobacteria bacterium]
MNRVHARPEADRASAPEVPMGGNAARTAESGWRAGLMRTLAGWMAACVDACSQWRMGEPGMSSTIVPPSPAQPVSAHPNAGLPNEFGEYDELPDDTAEIIAEFARAHLVNIVGGCCGTTPEHISAIVAATAAMAPRAVPDIPPACRLSGLEPFAINSESLFVNVGERCNVTGSARFKRLILEGDFDTALDVAREQVENGAQILDVNMDEGMLDAGSAMPEFLNLVASEPDISRIPIMVDSSKWEIIEAGLKCIQGKPVVNSISLKEGETAFIEQARLCRRYGAAVVVMAFDTEGQADNLARRIDICKRSYRILVEQAGFPPEDIIFDANVFAVATGIEEH